jgi:hypothetical protein
MFSGRAAPDKVQHQTNHRDDQQNVNQPAGNVERKKAEQPQYHQNKKYCDEHLKVTS